MTRYDAGHRLLDDIEKHNERAVAKFETQALLKSAYADELEDVIRHDAAHHAIAVEMLAGFMGIGVADVEATIRRRYEWEQKAKVDA